MKDLKQQTLMHSLIRRGKHCAFAIALPLFVIAVSGALSVQQDEKYSKIVKTLARELPREHLSRHNLDDNTSRQTLDNYLSAMDSERIYFLAEDIEAFSRKETLLDDELRAGNSDFAFEVYEVFKQRVENRTAYVKELLERGFDLSLDEDYRWKRKDAPWCSNRQEWDDLWRKRIKNEYLRRVIADALAETNTSVASIEAPAPGRDSTNVTTTVGATTPTQLEPKALEDATTLTPQEAPPTPEAAILDRFEQFQTTLQDSDSEWVMQKYLSAFARAYDPHCDYMSPTTAEDFDIEMKLSLFGIGALLSPEDGTAKIVRLIPGGPAARDESKNKLLPGDKIIAVAQDHEKSVSILHWPLYKAVRLIRGEKGTRVVLTVIPTTDPTGTITKQVILIRDEVKLEDRAAKSNIKTVTDINGKNVKLGVIELPAFYADLKGKRTNPDYKSSSRDVGRILREMREEDVSGIVLDLRNNGGGALLEAVLMTGLFIKTGPTVQVRERHTISILPDNDPSIVYSGPLIVLVNRLSASASEILAAALQDYGRAVIVGDSKTHGKGSVQTILGLNRSQSMGAIKVTNALFYRISGGSTQLRGVTPDIILPSAFEYMEFGEDFLDNPMEWSTVRPTIYSLFNDLSGEIKILSAQSLTRRQNNERFQAYRALLDRIKVLNTREALSLNMDKRKAQATEEKELLDIQNALMEQGEDEDEDEAKNEDVVKEEALRILVDMIHYNAKREASIAGINAR